ncbi:ABC transporter permease, partial [Mesorhizobium sp. M7A.T.Ca.TU.009.01.3.2]
MSQTSHTLAAGGDHPRPSGAMRGPQRRLRLAAYPSLLAMPALLLLIAAMGYPLLTVTLRSFSDPAWGLQNYVWFFSTPVNVTVLWRTFSIAAWVTIVCVIAAYPYAYLMTAVGPRLRLVLILCVLVPFWVSGVVRTLAWVILLQDSGIINSVIRLLGFDGVKLIRTQTGVVIGMAQVLLPFMILPLYSVMRGIDLRLVQAARSLGARPARAFLQIYLPLS